MHQYVFRFRNGFRRVFRWLPCITNENRVVVGDHVELIRFTTPRAAQGCGEVQPARRSPLGRRRLLAATRSTDRQSPSEQRLHLLPRRDRR